MSTTIKNKSHREISTYHLYFTLLFKPTLAKKYLPSLVKFVFYGWNEMKWLYNSCNLKYGYAYLNNYLPYLDNDSLVLKARSSAKFSYAQWTIELPSLDNAYHIIGNNNKHSIFVHRWSLYLLWYAEYLRAHRHVLILLAGGPWSSGAEVPLVEEIPHRLADGKLYASTQV